VQGFPGTLFLFGQHTCFRKGGNVPRSFSVTETAMATRRGRGKKKAKTKATAAEKEAAQKKALAKKASERKRAGRRVALEGARALQEQVGGPQRPRSPLTKRKEEEPTGSEAEEDNGVSVDLAALTGIEVTVPVEHGVSDERVDARIAELLRAYSPTTGLKDEEPLAMGDEVLIELMGYVDGDAFLARSDEWMILQPNPLLPMLFEQIAQGIVGEHKVVRIELPEDYPDPRHSGKAAAFVVQVKAANRVEPLSLDDPKAQEALDRGKKPETIKEAVRGELMVELADGLVAQARQLVLAEAEKRVELELPDEVIDTELLRLWRALEGDALAHGGATKEEQEAALQAWFGNDERREEVRRALWADRLLDAVARQNGIASNADEVVKIVVQSAAAANLPVSDVHTALVKDPELQEAMAEKLRRQHALEWLLGKATVHFGA
jgi:trigger factor